jgi:biopolymer transport protein ExbB/TolQ
MEINLVELWGRMEFSVKGVVLLLFVQALACATVTIDRVIMLVQSNKKSRAFAAGAQSAMDAGQYDQVLAFANELQGSHLASYLALGLRTFIGRVRSGDGPERAAELTRRALERKGDAISRQLNRGMNVLASTGSTAPFVGLLGTVLGILNAFKLIAANGSGGIATIGGAISEALVVTGGGLMVAIPSVLVFNWLSARLAEYESGMINAGSELVDRLETGAGFGPHAATGHAAPATGALPSNPRSASAIG